MVDRKVVEQFLNKKVGFAELKQALQKAGQLDDALRKNMRQYGVEDFELPRWAVESNPVYWFHVLGWAAVNEARWPTGMDHSMTLPADYQ